MVTRGVRIFKDFLEFGSFRLRTLGTSATDAL